MALESQNNILGGTVLMRAAIRSPNFVTGSSGWSINNDGSAEFNNIVIRGGAIISGTALYYSGTPALGNLIASINPGAQFTDIYGNTVLHGIASYNATGGADALYALLQGSGLIFADSTGTIFNNAAVVDIVQQGIASSAPALRLRSPTETTTDQAGLVMLSSNSGGTTKSMALLSSFGNTQQTNALLELQGGTAQTGVFVLVDAIGSSYWQCRLLADTNARIRATNQAIVFGSGTAAADVTLGRGAANLLQVSTADLEIHTAGRGLQVKGGANAKVGTATLVGGTVTVANTAVTANSIIKLGGTVGAVAANAGALFVSSATAATGFTVKSTNAADTSTFGYEITEQT